MVIKNEDTFKNKLAFSTSHRRRNVDDDVTAKRGSGVTVSISITAPFL
jgi:hypothetical protein